MLPSQSKSAALTARIASYQTKLHVIRRKHAAKKANGRRPSNDDPRLDQKIALADPRASLVAGLITEAGAVKRLSSREQLRLLDARKAGDELLALKVPNYESVIIDGNGKCCLVDLISVIRFGGLTSREPGVDPARHRRRSRAVHTKDGRCKSPCYLAFSCCVRADLT